MVQPGLSQQENFLEWLKHVSAMKALVSRDNGMSSDLKAGGGQTCDNPQAICGDRSLDLHTDGGSRPEKTKIFRLVVWKYSQNVNL